MEEEKLKEIIKQILYNPQVTPPPISYSITSKEVDGDYTADYIDIGDFNSYLKRLEAQLIFRLK